MSIGLAHRYNINNIMIKNFCIIAPIFPWKGGIAHHTNELVKNLLKLDVNISIISFSRLYPKWLYPGKSQKEPESTKNPLTIRPEYILNPINPFTWWFTARKILRERHETVIIKYWHPFFIPCFAFVAWYLRLNKIQVVAIAENFFSHERYFGDLVLLKIFFHQVKKIITLSLIVSDQCNKVFPQIPSIMIPLPKYDQFWPIVGQKKAREKLQINKDRTILLFFWFIRPYKGLDILLNILPDLIRKRPDIHLIIAGECFWSFQIYQDIIDRNNLKSHLTLHLKYIPNSLIPYYFWACDLLVMPYRHITNSGIESIGEIYANKMLLTVGVSGNILEENIIKSLNTSSSLDWEGISWESYCMSLHNFLYNQV